MGVAALGGCLFPAISWGESSDALAPSKGDSLAGLAADAQGAGTPFLFRGTRETRKIALTFDDGPSPGVTEPVLDALEKNGAKATFFMIGRRVKSSPDLAKRVHSAGHEIANHSYTHPVLGKMSDEQVRQELQLCQETISGTVGITPTWFRPPYGSFRTSQGALTKAQKLGVVIWSVDPRDWARPGADVITRRVLGGSCGGDIILCHDLHAQTAHAAPSMIEGLVKKGYQLVTLSELILG